MEDVKHHHDETLNSGTRDSCKLAVWQNSKLPSSGRAKVAEDKVETIRATFLQSPRKSTCRASRELQIPHTTIHKCYTNAYKVQIVQALKAQTNQAVCGSQWICWLE
ncbi:hypothetical protein PR048_030637 [Dryococelus australis]|uniref:HTH psq-type domain-containing protein n=1 Tax=Dryococelus australis TaxID=614101 RepID=A0ABQ9G9J9_9NEOP|nr:hypothetical protein PR048_030637 [Dryococelus australis]